MRPALMVLLVIASAIGGSVWAEPNKDNPAAGLSTHGTMAGAERLATDAYAMLADIEGVLDQAEQAIAAGKPERIAPKPIGQAAVKTAQAERLGLQLVQMGEPAGTDIRLRLQQIRKRTGDAVNTYRSTPAGSKLLQVLQVQMARGEPARYRVAQKIEQQAAENLPQAEAALHQALDSLHPAGIFDPARGVKSFYTPFNQAQALIEQPMARARREQTNKRCAELLEDLTNTATAWLADAAEAATALESSGQASVEGQLVSGPVALEQYGKQWGQGHAAIMQASALMMITSSSGHGNYSTSSPAGSDTTALTDALELERRMADQAVQVFSQMILADVQTASPADAKQRYLAYLASLSPLERRVAGNQLRDACSEPLDRLAEKANLQSDIAAYRQATDEILRWRKRLADTQSAKLAQGYPALPALNRQTFQSHEGYVGLYPEPGNRTQFGPATATLRASAMDTLTPVLPLLIGQNATVTDVLRVTPASSATIAPYRDSTYANVPVPSGLDSYLAALRSDLLVDDAHPPLTLHAAAAIQSAEQAEYARVGGKVANVHLEGLVTRLKTLPAVASIFAPRGTLPATEALPTYFDQIVVRYDITPAWVHHDYFVAILAQ